MSYPVQLSFRNVDPSSVIAENIEKRAERLSRYYKGIISCRVLVEAPHRHHHKGNLYRVLVDLSVPGHELVVGRNPTEHVAHADPYVAIRDAFASLERQLREWVRLRRGDTKRHENGRVAPTPPPSASSKVEWEWEAVS